MLGCSVQILSCEAVALLPTCQADASSLAAARVLYDGEARRTEDIC